MANNINFKQLRETLYAGLVCDVLDYFGYRNQSLGSEFYPIVPGSVLFGRAYTVVAQPVVVVPEDALVNQCRSIEGVQENDVYVLSTVGGYNAGIWGEIMATALRVRKGTGALIDGMVRDTRQLVEMQFPVIGRGHLPTTSKGRTEITAWKVPIEIDGVRINPGDLIFGDVDGVAVIPQEIEDQVLERCLHILSNENLVRDKILAGESIVETYLEIGAI